MCTRGHEFGAMPPTKLSLSFNSMFNHVVDCIGSVVTSLDQSVTSLVTFQWIGHQRKWQRLKVTSPPGDSTASAMGIMQHSLIEQFLFHYSSYNITITCF